MRVLYNQVSETTNKIGMIATKFRFYQNKPDKTAFRLKQEKNNSHLAFMNIH